MAKIDDIKKEIEDYKELIADASVPQDEKDFAKEEIAELEKQLEALEKKTEKKSEDKPKEKAEKKPEAKSEKPKREKGEEDEADCDDLIERETKASKLGYDIDELLAQAKERKAKAKKRAEERKNEPKKTPITKAKEKVERTTEVIVKGLKSRADKGKLSVADLERLISEYEDALKKLKKMLEGLRAEKMARGGKTKPKRPKMVRTQFEEEEFDYQYGGGVQEYRRGGRTTMTDLKRDKLFRAKPSGKRKSKKIAIVEMKGGGSYRRRNSNQYYNDDLGNRSQIGGRTYYEGANNRSDKNKWS